MTEEMRIDKWLWATRVFKTRSIAADACKKGRVHIGNRPAKPAMNVRVGDTVMVRKPPITFSFRVVGLTPNRVGAKLVEQFLKNVTPPEEYRILELQRMSESGVRARGTGRPTKKERRDLDRFMSPDDTNAYHIWEEMDDDLGATPYDLLSQQVEMENDEADVLDSMGFWDE